MSGLPITFDIAGQTVLLVGGGQRALPKLRRLLGSRARVKLVAPEISSAVSDLLSDRVAWVSREFEHYDTEGTTLVFGATGIDAVDRAVAAVARDKGIPVNVVDRPDLCDFTVPAIVDRSPVLVAISTGGAAPLLARQIRRRIEALLPAKLGRIAEFSKRFRETEQRVVPDQIARRRLWQDVFGGDIAGAVLRGDEAAAHQAMLTKINSVSAQGTLSGSVAIVGAGPGDPELLTLRALRFLEQADVIIHDRLVGDAILDLARRDATFISVGKQRGHHSVTQDGIHQLMADHAEAGQRVVRLKGGDPMIFGRGGEELEFLMNRGIAAEVVPGITAAAGCAAAAGLPLTHRDWAHGLTLVSGEGKDGPIEADWAALAQQDHTVGVYMGVRRAGHIASQLMRHGRASSTPIAVIENGTLPQQRLIRGTLGELQSLIIAHDVKAPAFLVIGPVAGFAGGQTAPVDDAAPALAIAAE